jgi:protein-disulfide isomerase
VTAADSAFRGFTLGSDSAPVEVVEYADFQCPHCGEFTVVQFPTIRDQLINAGRVRWRFRDFPIGGAFAWSRVSALAAQCAGEQGRFWEMADALYQRQSDWGRNPKNPSGTFHDLARAAGVDAGKYDACMDAQRYAGRLEASHQEGIARGVNGTPTFFINGRLHEFPRGATSDAFQAVVDSLLRKRS